MSEEKKPGTGATGDFPRSSGFSCQYCCAKPGEAHKPDCGGVADQKIIDKQVAAWRAEVARLNDMIAHTTGASSQPDPAQGGVDADSIPTWQERAKEAGNWPCFSGDAAALYMKPEIADLRAALAAKPAAQSVKVDVAEGQMIDGVFWPAGYGTDPGGAIIAPAGKHEDFTFGYNIGWAEGFQSIKDSVKEIESRVYASLSGKAALSDDQIDALMVHGLPNTRPSAGFRQFARACVAAAQSGAAQKAVGKFAIEVEKMLCKALGREWSATGISIESLINELASRSGAAGAVPVGEIVNFGDQALKEVSWSKGKMPPIGTKLYATPTTAATPTAGEAVADWAEAERISNLPSVDEAIRAFDADATGDNATGMVLAVLEATAGTAALTEQARDAMRLEVDRLNKMLREADDLLWIASGAMLKMGLRDRGSDCGLSHEVRMFALEFSREGSDGPGALQVKGTGRYHTWLVAARAAMQTTTPNTGDAE